MATSALPPMSVVLPCFNAARYIVAALESVIAQDWPDLEIVVVDDGSTDGSSDEIAKYSRNVRVVRQSNQGIAAARNAGIAAAANEWIAFLDADDLWLPGKLAAQWRVLQDDRGARMSYTAWDVWASSEPYPASEYLAALAERATSPAMWAGPSGWIYPDLLLDSAVWTSTVLLHRSLLDDIGSFDPTLTIGEDYDLWIRASQATRVVRVNAPFALYRMHASSITKAAPRRNYRGEVVQRALDRWGLRSPDGRRASSADVTRHLAQTWIEFGSMHWRDGHRVVAREAAFKAVRTDPAMPAAWVFLVQSMLRAQIRKR